MSFDISRIIFPAYFYAYIDNKIKAKTCLKKTTPFHNIVSVGYEYENCDHVFWTTIVTSLDAYVMVFSGMGGWKLDLYHSYNLQKGLRCSFLIFFSFTLELFHSRHFGF